MAVSVSSFCEKEAKHFFRQEATKGVLEEKRFKNPLVNILPVTASERQGLPYGVSLRLPLDPLLSLM